MSRIATHTGSHQPQPPSSAAGVVPQAPNTGSRYAGMIAKAAGALCLLAVALFALVSAGYGSTSGQPVSATRTSPSTTSIVIVNPASTHTPVHHASRQATPAIAHLGAPDGISACGEELSVGPDTTCAFAANVRAAYESAGPGTVSVYSPVTNESYAMTCSAGSQVICTGGNSASVYFRAQSAPSSYDYAEHEYAPAAQNSYGSDGNSPSNCGNDLSAGPNTSCAFAEAVRSAYDASGPGTVSAYSPVTNRTYTMTCSAGSPVACTGANHASVHFP